MAARRYLVVDRAGFDKIDGPAQGMARSLCEVEELVERYQAAIGIEFHKKVGVAGLRIEIRPARRGAADFEPRHAVTPAEFGQFFPLVSDGAVHAQPSHSGGKRCPSSTSL